MLKPVMERLMIQVIVQAFMSSPRHWIAMRIPMSKFAMVSPMIEIIVVRIVVRTGTIIAVRVGSHRLRSEDSQRTDCCPVHAEPGPDPQRC